MACILTLLFIHRVVVICTFITHLQANPMRSLESFILFSSPWKFSEAIFVCQIFIPCCSILRMVPPFGIYYIVLAKRALPFLTYWWQHCLFMLSILVKISTDHIFSIIYEISYQCVGFIACYWSKLGHVWCFSFTLSRFELLIIIMIDVVVCQGVAFLWNSHRFIVIE